MAHPCHSEKSNNEEALPSSAILNEVKNLSFQILRPAQDDSKQVNFCP